MGESNITIHTSSDRFKNLSSASSGNIVYPNKCYEHNNSDLLNFVKYGKLVKRGCCLLHSRYGYVTFSGIDVDSGKLLQLTEWNIKYSQIEKKCLSNCFWFGEIECCGHKIDDFIAGVEKHVTVLSQMNHKHLISYEYVLCIKKSEQLTIYLAQDFVSGSNILSITKSIGWNTEGVKVVTKGILNALIFLNNNGLSHGYLDGTNVLIDKLGQVRCADFSLVPHLLVLITSQKQVIYGDLLSLGILIENLMLALPYDLKNFVDRCKSNPGLSATDLLNHSFLRRSSIHQPAQQSRLETEFEILQYHEKGAFGDVLKVRNILDKREYAIKRIPLLATNEQLYEKIIREVELLSRLNHVNVVRYFNSWIEEISLEFEEIEKKDNINSSKNILSINDQLNREQSSLNVWKSIEQNDANSNSDSIEFVDSEGKVVTHDDENRSSEKEIRLPKSLLKQFNQVMYIQMEFCEKSTLRQSIDGNLYKNTVRSWQLFREILEGLFYIHQQGIIHRDLKPDNIFLDSRDQIKIGDFGLATTNFSTLQSNELNDAELETNNNVKSIGTGKVGTILYVAPELTGNASKSIYNQKVDMYTLGIILFEMSNPPFNTTMERVKTITALRSKDITLPDKMIKDAWYEQNEIIRWLLKHDPCQRPTAKELLNSNLMLQGNFKAYVASEANFT